MEIWAFNSHHVKRKHVLQVAKGGLGFSEKPNGQIWACKPNTFPIILFFPCPRPAGESRRSSPLSFHCTVFVLRFYFVPSKRGRSSLLTIGRSREDILGLGSGNFCYYLSLLIVIVDLWPPLMS
jgi:hypothetical protein